MRTEAFLSVGGYRAALAQPEDWDLWLRIAERFQLANLNEVVVKYGIHPNQVSLRKLRLAEVKEITPALLADLGVKESTQQTALARAVATAKLLDGSSGLCFLQDRDDLFFTVS
jgi:hypothetical protein